MPSFVKNTIVSGIKAALYDVSNTSRKWNAIVFQMLWLFIYQSTNYYCTNFFFRNWSLATFGLKSRLSLTHRFMSTNIVTYVRSNVGRIHNTSMSKESSKHEYKYTCMSLYVYVAKNTKDFSISKTKNPTQLFRSLILLWQTKSPKNIQRKSGS